MNENVMEIGMLWFDNDPKLDILRKIKKAADYYKNKYCESPNLCFVHPGMMPDEALMADEMAVCVDSSMLPHHFWIGVQQQNNPVP